MLSNLLILGSMRQFNFYFRHNSSGNLHFVTNLFIANYLCYRYSFKESCRSVASFVSVYNQTIDNLVNLN